MTSAPTQPTDRPGTRALQEMFASPDGRARLHELITDAVADVTDLDVTTLTPETSLADVGLDSLALSEVLVVVEERLGCELPDSVLAQATSLPAEPTLADVLSFIDTAATALET